MNIRLLVGYTCIAASALSGCGTISQRGSANLAPMIEQFPFQASRPLARELRYTYTNLWVIDGTPRKPQFASNQATWANASGRTPAAVLAAASQPAPRFSDALSKALDEQARKGASGQFMVESRGAAASMAAAENSLATAQATAGAMYSVLAAAEQMVAAWTQQTTDLLGGWIRSNTGAIGAEAPEGSVLQIDFTYMLTGRSFRTDSRSDVLVKAVVSDGKGGTFESTQAFQFYTYVNEPSIEIPKDAIRIDPWLVPPEKRDVVKPLYGDNWFNTHLVVAASAALADIYRQLETK